MVSPNVQREVLAVNCLLVNMVVVLCQRLFVAAMEYTAVPMDILATCLLEPVRKETAVYQWLRKCWHQNKEVQRVTKFVPMVSPNVQMEALAVNSLQVDMAVVLFQMLFVAAMENTAVPMDILATCLLEPVPTEAAVYQWLRKRRHQNKEVQRVTKFVPMVSPNVQMEALAVNSLQVDMAVVLFQMLFVAAMENTAVPMDILATCLLEPVPTEAAV